MPGTGNIGISQTSPTYKLDITGDIRSTTSAYFATSSGNVGVGTTSPAGILDILGQCVTGDTVLKRRRRRRRKGRNGEWEEVWEDVRIDEIQPGDIILTFDEISGRMVPQKVVQLMNKGDQEVFELITESGKHIQTTANHPYLVDSFQKMTVSNLEYIQKKHMSTRKTWGKSTMLNFLPVKRFTVHR